MRHVEKRRCMGWVGSLTLVPLWAAPVLAQPFEYVYGGPTSVEQGRPRRRTSTWCA